MAKSSRPSSGSKQSKSSKGSKDIDISLEAAPAVLYDALVLPSGADAVTTLGGDGRTLEFIKDQYRHCKPTLALGESGHHGEDFDETTMDACLIAAGQRAEHYEMAAYGTLVALAQAMGHTEAAKLLQQTLDEEKAADKKLSGLAESGINQSAADAAHADEEQEPVGAGTSSGRKTASSARTGRR